MAGELDDLEARRTTGVSEDNEEYDKELEDRLIGLDEVALKERVKKNAERQKSVSLGELYKILDIPEDVLARTCEAAPRELSCPEYWLEWYRKTLATTEAAKRANRGFRSTSNEEAVLEVERENNVPARTDSVDDKGELEEPGGVFSVRSRPPPENPKPPDGSVDVDEFVVQENGDGVLGYVNLIAGPERWRDSESDELGLTDLPREEWTYAELFWKASESSPLFKESRPYLRDSSTVFPLNCS
ncbi:hypothetical protein PPTG_20444 [Phytophthora nicotianae INRA-310]|uniref:Uncharacterized protein n=1 Tax=Phytophthora nicotianae (strain INRA-310) TaxID=761204 RepID=W2PAE9_PHYN3|nr:hypothetical protein PPTG_20444 [Phytophthora nicotianae INRA-310]ETM97218.1 hypothetical protein PPTG_20444 [Phytophthora nicotianae INRA-310]